MSQKPTAQHNHQPEQGSKGHNEANKSHGSGDRKEADQQANVGKGNNTQAGQQKTDSGKKNHSGSSQQK